MEQAPKDDAPNDAVNNAANDPAEDAANDAVNAASNDAPKSDWPLLGGESTISGEQNALQPSYAAMLKN